MTPSDVKMISFFFSVEPENKEDAAFIHNLSYKEVGYELENGEHDELFRIYDSHAPKTSSDLFVIKDILRILTTIEACKFTFVDEEGNAVLNGYKQPMTGEF